MSVKVAFALALVACSGSSTSHPNEPGVTAPTAPIDAAPAPPDAPPPDAGPSQAVLDAPPWVFRYTTKDRAETWTLRTADGNAILIVESATGKQIYLGTATGIDSMKLDVMAGRAEMKLECKRTKRPLSTKCNDTKAKPVEVYDCYHPDFKTPMPFGHSPGVEYAVDATCNGYRLLAK